MRGADVGAGAAADAAALHRLDQPFTVALSQLERTGAHDFLADPFAQQAADAPVGRRVDADAEFLGQVNEPLGLGGLLQEGPHGFLAGGLDGHALGLDDKSGMGLDQTGTFEFRRLAGGCGLHGAQAADADRFVQGRVKANRRKPDACDLQGLQKAFTLFDLKLLLLTRIEIMAGNIRTR